MTTNSTTSEAQWAEERFRLVVESSPAAIVIVDRSGRIVLVNRQTENWFGYPREELTGQEIEVLVPERFHPRHRSDRDQYLATPTLRPMGVDGDLVGRRRNGSEFPVDISLHPMATEQGVMVMAHVVDLTDRKQAEIEVQKRHSLERLALLGQLAAGVAHEIRNPLGVIRNAAYYLEMVRDSLDEEARASIAEIDREIQRANHIVNDLLDYAREPVRQACEFNLNDHLREIIPTIEQSLGATIRFQPTIESVRVLADPEHVHRILMNLIRNGVQASAGVGRIALTVNRHTSSVAVDVTDEGSGIDRCLRDRVFEPLFSTKAQGIGLGLAISRQYAERNGGSLELIDGSESGATFRLSLPLAVPE